ncbi:hypothetical protein B2G71_21755 [Novosphingobium sp. PC22D]|uniref:HAMP domain-containing sensor histidine kinase n=1 Tax=Novosphingobium sp. PC22D TaxID=1962403 RepID=UPI000BF1C5F3|nr:ATP-binding protein [Novosphingobium sp. PC22D]PEQ10519.1 hypothetical protein B2G71_21755 [Novosphingobium sp. PC22D]
MVLLLGLALLLAQLASFALVWNDRQEISRARNEAPAITRFAEAAGDIAAADPEYRDLLVKDASRRGAGFTLVSNPSITASERDSDLEQRVSEALADTGLGNTEVEAARLAPVGGSGPDADRPVLRIAARIADDTWIAGRFRSRPQDPTLIYRLGAATLLLYLFVLGAAAWGTRSINRPLRELTDAAHEFTGRSSAPALQPHGPDDVREAMEAFNAMNARIISLLEEKDYLLGAIGHDLRTPLASLRVRIESMEPEEDREAAIAKIEEMTAMLEDILVLARTTRAQRRPMDLTALVEALVEEYAELERPVTFEPSSRVTAEIAPDLLRRALRNLIDNAVIYAGSAQLRVLGEDGKAIVELRDSGSGIPPEERERVVQPFQRLETSRSRETGGSGLGLAIARSIAESHGGSLELRSNAPQGLAVRLGIAEREA